MTVSEEHFPRGKPHKSPGEGELSILAYILSDEQNHSNCYEKAIADRLELNTGYVHSALEKLRGEGYLWTYGSKGRGRGKKHLHHPDYPALFRLIAETDNAGIRQVKRWLWNMGLQSHDLLTAFLPEDLDHLRNVCHNALDMITRARAAKLSNNPLRALYAATIAYFLTQPELRKERQRVTVTNQALRRLFDNRQFGQFFLALPGEYP